ncbi:MAG: hypothetical protein V1777_00315 [Candidatus Micrarchaeota archaeon]
MKASRYAFFLVFLIFFGCFVSALEIVQVSLPGTPATGTPASGSSIIIPVGQLTPVGSGPVVSTVEKPLSLSIQGLSGAPLTVDLLKKNPQAFELVIGDVNQQKPLVLGVGASLSCDKIANLVNTNKLKLDESWWDKTKKVSLRGWYWLKFLVVGDSSQVPEGVKRIQSGAWLAGGSQVTGAEFGRLLVGAGVIVVYGVKGVVVSVVEGVKAAYYEIKSAVQAPTGPAPVPVESTGGINVSDLVSATGTLPPEDYLQVNAEDMKLYVIGNQDWVDRLGMKNVWHIEKIDNISVSELKNDKTVHVIACQFSQDAAGNLSSPSKNKAELILHFGGVTCSTIQECLGMVDDMFMRIFSGQ